MAELTKQIIEASVARYIRERDRYQKLATRVAAICEERLRSNAIRAHVTFRTKDSDRLRKKLEKYLEQPDERQNMGSVDAVFARIGDLAGVRITTYEEADRDKVQKIIETAFASQTGEPSKAKVQDKTIPENFYRATHCQVGLPLDNLQDGDENLSEVTAEIQICSMLAHVWNEIEHDLRYKKLTGELSQVELDLLQQLGHLMLAGDTAIKTLFTRASERRREIQDEFLDPADFVTRMRKYYPELTNLQDESEQLFEELMSLGKKNPKHVTEYLAPEKTSALQEMVRNFARWLAASGQGVARSPLSDIGADVLMLGVFVQDAEQVIRRYQGPGAPQRIVRLARHYLNWTRDTESSRNQPATTSTAEDE